MVVAVEVGMVVLEVKVRGAGGSDGSVGSMDNSKAIPLANISRLRNPPKHSVNTNSKHTVIETHDPTCVGMS